MNKGQFTECLIRPNIIWVSVGNEKTRKHQVKFCTFRGEGPFMFRTRIGEIYEYAKLSNVSE